MSNPIDFDGHEDLNKRSIIKKVHDLVYHKRV